MTMPTLNELNRPALHVIANSSEAIHISDIRAQLVDHFGLTATDLEETMESGEKRFDNRLRWAVGFLRRAGLSHSPFKGAFQCTSEGKVFLEKHSGLIERKTLMELIEKQRIGVDAVEEIDQTTPIADSSTDTNLDDLSDATPDDQIELAFQLTIEGLVDDLIDSISRVSPDRFEILVLELLAKMGYGEPEHTGKSSDGGIDGVINRDALGLEKVYVQAKRWANQVGEPEIRNFSGSLDPFGATKGVFITTSTFSKTARQTARAISAGPKLIRLVDGNELAHLMIQHGVGVVTKNTYQIKKLDENYFGEEF